eukprot:682970-Pleurochrysis_carterae.AAC.1
MGHRLNARRCRGAGKQYTHMSSKVPQIATCSRGGCGRAEARIKRRKRKSQEPLQQQESLPWTTSAASARALTLWRNPSG